MAPATAELTSVTVTSTKLLSDLATPGNDSAWHDFVARYRPVLVSFGRRAGLSLDDADDAAQETLRSFAVAYRAGKYDRQKGRLRHWLFGIATNHIRKARQQVKKRRDRGEGGDGEMQPFAELPAHDDLADAWEEEWRRAILQQCLVEAKRHFSEKMIKAFEMFACEGRPGSEVGAQLGMTEGAVYLAKHKVLAYVRQITPAVEEIW